jgi:hypothetical protein
MFPLLVSCGSATHSSNGSSGSKRVAIPQGPVVEKSSLLSGNSSSGTEVLEGVRKNEYREIIMMKSFDALRTLFRVGSSLLINVSGRGALGSSRPLWAYWQADCWGYAASTEVCIRNSQFAVRTCLGVVTTGFLIG